MIRIRPIEPKQTRWIGCGLSKRTVRFDPDQTSAAVSKDLGTSSAGELALLHQAT
jgi:hypothetical protein